ncbi:hypothetical protein MTR62_18555 [Novosphingobium sp. 1949]|uniref:Lipoprotein n=1 Tax=Novosphingobium organovorum TaxID=2930092 RepID=A0ABT0BI05_9SPHN|nr:hypothetical protein [Novosphingobium organovorum]MCJ2184674.1 hypothetical protein [Novosphingobium organovorum]
MTMLHRQDLRAGSPVALGAFCALALALAGCSAKPQPEAAPSDPAMTGALGDDILVDPDMTGQDGSAVSADDGEVSLPPEDRSPEAIADARKQALALAGGKLRAAPQPQAGGAEELAEGAATAAQVARASQQARTDCTKALAFSNTWAAKLPAAFPVYPRGAVNDAAGVNADGCAMIVVNYATPVSPTDIIAFYYTMASKAGYGAQYRTADGQSVLGGRKGGQAYVVYANTAAKGVTEVNLFVSGK